MKSLIKELLQEERIDGLPREWFSKKGIGASLPENASSAIASENTRSPKTYPVAEVDFRAVDFRSMLAFDKLEREASGCTLCSLCETRNTVVFGAGNSKQPLIAFVGEGPGADEDQTGQPFVGRAGQLLNGAIEKGLGLKREDLYICNVVKCRPPENRTPLPNEVLACSPYLFRQLELVQPKVIITLGQTPQLALSGVDLGITKLRGQWQEWRGIPLMPTYHPAYILRNPPAKKPFWEDLQAVMKFLGLTPPKN
jgi:uracil-DNA glycosylase family 4